MKKKNWKSQRKVREFCQRKKVGTLLTLLYRDFVEVMCSEIGNLNINERDDHGLTALYYAVTAGAVRFSEIKLKCPKISVHLH